MVSLSCRHHFDWWYWTSSLEMVLILSCFHPSVNSLYILIWWRGNPRICSMMGQQRSGGAPHNGRFWAKDLNYPFSWERPLSHSWGGKFNLSPPQDVIITRKHIGMSLAMVLPKATSKVLVNKLFICKAQMCIWSFKTYLLDIELVFDEQWVVTQSHFRGERIIRY